MIFERWRGRRKQQEPTERPKTRGMKEALTSELFNAEEEVLKAESALGGAWMTSGSQEVKAARERLQKAWTERDRIVRGEPKPPKDSQK